MFSVERVLRVYSVQKKETVLVVLGWIYFYCSLSAAG